MKKGLAGYISASIMLLAYVGACSRFWDEASSSDAWEHHRAIKAMADDLWHPRNPTFATEEPSIRYSPYTLVMAVLQRYGGIDPFNALGAAAVFNTVLMLVGVYALMSAFGEAEAAAAVLIVAVTTWGGPPGYANSYALADLPWHQLNPSAFASGLSLMIWAVAVRRRGGLISATASGVALGVACLSHPMTGLFGIAGLVVLAATTSPRDRASVTWLATTVGVAVVVCLAWPWYSFWEAARARRDVDYWFNPYVLMRMYDEWCLPALIMTVAALPYHRERIARFCLVGAAGCFALGGLSVVFRSPTLARLPMPAMIFLHIPIGLFVHRSGLLRPSTWPERFRAAWGGGDSRRAGLELIVAVILGCCLAPQLWDVARKPYLARSYVARLAGRESGMRRPKAEYDSLLRGVGKRDVVLGSPVVAWPVPSSRGRIVSALHYEFFTPDQPARDKAVATFFTSKDPLIRASILDRYDVRWLVVDTSGIDQFDLSEFENSRAVVARSAHMRLLDADGWRAERGLPAKQSGAGALPNQRSSISMSGPRAARPPALRERTGSS